MALGDKLRQIRLQKNIGQHEIARKLGYQTNSYVSNVENNHFIPSIDKLQKWTEILGLSPEKTEDLITEAKLEEMGVTDPGFTSMLKAIPNMTNEEKRSILRAWEAVEEARGRQRTRKKTK